MHDCSWAGKLHVQVGHTKKHPPMAAMVSSCVCVIIMFIFKFRNKAFLVSYFPVTILNKEADAFWMYAIHTRTLLHGVVRITVTTVCTIHTSVTTSTPELPSVLVGQRNLTETSRRLRIRQVN